MSTNDDSQTQGAAIAIVGIAGRFPGAPDHRTLWKNLREGLESITQFKPEELEDAFSDETRTREEFIAAKPILDDVDLFDAEFFGMHAREAALTDPQQRVFLECCWQALEDAGHDPAKFNGAIGVFAGCTMNTYFMKHVCPDQASLDEFTSNFQVGGYQEFLGSIRDLVATRVAYKLDLRGPAVNVQTACSTSLVAVAQACQSLLLYQSDMALAGGVSITFPQRRGYLALEGGMVSTDGHCRPFDAKASGTIFGSGAGVVVLKRLDDALADGDHVYAVIRGFGLNNDGASKIGLTAPSVEGQAEVIASALAMAGVDAGDIGYVEAHGTATPLGDPIEFRAIEKAYRASTQKRGYCVLGSSKANFGHLDAAAGVTGLIKAALVLDREEIPPLINFTAPNPNIDLAQSPFKIVTELTPWPARGAPRLAAVSAFGVGGTNAHLVLEEAPRRKAKAASDRAVHILPLSARTPESLARMAAALADRLENDPTLDLADVAYTLQIGRCAFDTRIAIAARDRGQAIERLRAAGPDRARRAAAGPKIVFMFPGQGAQYPGMGKALYESEPVYRRHVDAGAALFKTLTGTDLLALLHGEAPTDDDAPHPIRSTVLAQPALFIVEHAMAQLLISRGVEPAAMIGHSVGEFIAACLAGVMSFEDALTLVAARGRLMQDQEPGAMLSVRAPEDRLKPLLPEGAELAAVNAPSLSVAAGPFAAIEALEAKLDAAEISHRRLHTSHAFHSAMMDGVVEGLKRETERVKFAAPKRRYVSAVTGTWVRAEEASSPDYWARHCREPVRFADALATLLEDKDLILIEVGPGRTLSTFAGQAKNKAGVRATIATLPEFAARGEDCATFAEALAALWSEGLGLDWSKMKAADAKRVALPAYAFARKRHWIEAPAAVRESESAGVPPALADSTQGTALGNTESAGETPALPDFVEPELIEQEPIMTDRPALLRAQIQKMLEELSGESLDGGSHAASFLELGFDSLFLGQVAKRVQKTYGVKIAFRQLMREYPSIEALADHLMKTAKPESLPAAAAAPAPKPAAVPAVKAPAPSGSAGILPALAAAPSQQRAGGTPALPDKMPQLTNGSGIENILQSQLVAMQQLIAQQLQTLQTIAGATPSVAMPAAAPQAVAAAPASKPAAPEIKFEDATPSRFAMYKPGQKSNVEGMTPAQQRFIDDLAARYSKKCPTSKQKTQDARAVLADPRTAAGFRAEWKELVFPIVSPRSKGSKIWDVDGNEYVDLVNGFGQTMFGHAPDFVVDAVTKQLKEGFAIGPQSPIAGEVARMFAEMTGNERVTFCNTGSEAVMAAMRVARTVTGREKVVVFSGDYHGQFDEVLVKSGAGKGGPGALPIAPGIPQESVDNMIVLPYATPQSLAWVRANADDLAAVVVEVVQSRHPNLQPREFLSDLREITTASGAALVFDEVVTGFRAHQGGMQALFNIKADMATYGKVVGGGMPVGVLAGKAEFMDALDGGVWQYGDDSLPETAPTFFAGTFVRHPLTLAACHAVLLHLKQKGPKLQEDLTAKTKRMAEEMNAYLALRGVKTRMETFSSWCYATFSAEDPLASLFYAHMRLMGVHLLEGFPWFLTTTHTDADIAKIVDAFKKSIDALQAAGILSGSAGVPPALADSTQGPAHGGAQRAGGTPALPDGAGAKLNGSGTHAAIIEAPLTEEQTEVWLAAQLSDGASCAYNESATLTLEGPLHADALIAGLNDVVARHEALRATISPQGDCLRIAPALTLEVPRIDLANAPDADARFKAIQDEEARTPFDLAKGPLFRARLVRRAADRHALVFTAHHIVCDGWSGSLVMQELGAFYNARIAGLEAELDPVLPLHRYAQERSTKQHDPAAEEYWLGEYKDMPPPLELPTDRPRPSVKTFRGATLTAYIDAELMNAVRRAGKAHGTTLFATLFAATQVMLGKLGGAEDIALTVPMAGQTLVEDEVLFGHCVNFLPVRARFDATQSFGAHLETVKDKIFAAIDHQQYTYGTLVHKLGLKRDPNRTPITDVQFNHEKFGSGLAFEGLKASALTNPKAFVNFDLFLNMTESEAGVRVDVDYSTDLYDEATIERWIGHLRTLLAAIAKDTSRPIADLPLLDEKQTHWLTHDLNATAKPYPKQLIHELIETQAQKTPDAIAFECEGDNLTYWALMSRVDDMAARLAALVPGGGQRIAVALPRSLMLPVALLAVLKSGNAYVPLDPTHPAARLTQTLEAARVSALICADDAIAGIAAADMKVVRTDHTLPEVKAAPVRPREGTAAPAYVIFTSGSTGTPKGVEIAHKSVVNFLLSMAAEPGFAAKDTIVAVTTVSFDIAGLELFLPLAVGGRCVIVSREQVRDGFALAGAINAAGATVLQATPSLWRMLIEAGLKLGPHLKMLCGGEPLPRDLANTLLAGGGELWNVYGPTETTIWSSTGRVEKGDGAITIGAPIANTQIHILDAHDQLAPIGAVGDVYIGGDGLARGYFNRDDLTQAAFRTIKLGGKDERLYRTGDVGRRLANGAIQLQGRKDQQVKLRGYRIELEDIETHLRRAPGVIDAAVAVQSANEADARLVGHYVAANGQEIPSATLVRHLAEKLPEYMVPSLWQRLDAMPQTANGKLNRKALPPVRFLRPKTVAQTAAPQLTALEAKVATAWKDLLQTEDVGIDTHFFEAGGHSVLAMQMVARLQNNLGRQITMADLFRCPRLRDFATQIAAADVDADTQRIIPIQPLGTDTPLIVFNNNWDLYPLSKAIGANRPLISIQFVDRTIKEPKPAQNFTEIVDEAVRLVRRARPNGPYILAGHCVLGAVAYETAQRLKSEGEEVSLVVLLDSEPTRRFKGIPLGQKLKNAAVHHVRDARWLFGLWAEKKVNLLYVIARYRTARRTGFVAVAKALGFKERWNPEDYHTQHVVDAWTDHASMPFDGDVVIYRALPHERLGFLDRWAPWVPIWKSLIGDRLSVKELKVAHAEIFRQPAAGEIGAHMTTLLASIERAGANKTGRLAA